MLNHLSIRNIAVISSLEIDLGSGISVLTGETGAGKSIIIDSINMILGDRANKDLIRHGEDKASVQAIFDSDAEINGILEENDIDTEDGQIIVSRQITRDGKSISRINGTVVTLSLLREIAGRLINIHGQHDNQALLTASKHISFLDGYADSGKILAEYRETYSMMRKTEREIERLTLNEKEKMQRIDLLEYQISEIESAKLEDGEEETLIEQRNIAANAEKIKSAVNAAYSNIYENEDVPSAYDSLSIALNALSETTEINSSLKAAYDSISEALYSIEDSAHELKEFGDSVEFDEETLNDIEDRLELISRLKRKYGNSIAEVLKFLEKGKNELVDIKLSDEKIEELRGNLAELSDKLKKEGQSLSELRKTGAAELQKKIENSLHELNMEKSVFSVHMETGTEFLENGMDRMEFMISTNPGEPLKPLVKIASGGELSRVMLAMKSVLADTDGVGTLIFDEIDTGVSGNAALKIAKKLREIGRTKQVICITHLPQLAAAADTHYLIEKNTEGSMASTTLTELSRSGREAEIARIIDGGEASALSLEHACEMLENSAKQ